MTRLLRWSTRSALVASLWMAAGSAEAAGPCDNILQMLRVNVPVDVIVDNMRSYELTEDDLKCLVDGEAPEEILAAAREQLPEVEAPEAPAAEEQVEEAPPASRFETTETIGDDFDESEEEATAAGSAELEQYINDYKAGKYLTSSYGLFQLLEENAFPEKESTIKYYLAKSLQALDMNHSAQHYYMEVIRKGGPKNPLFKFALPRLAQITAITGDDNEVRRIVGRLDPAQYPRQARPHLHYLMGLREYDDGNLADASAHFGEIPVDHSLYPRAQYFEGMINYQRDKLKSAVKSFREVLRAEVPTDDPRIAYELEELKDLSLVNIGRIYFKIERMDQAEKYYSKVARDSIHWPESLFERSWTAFYAGDYNKSLGLLTSADSPYFADHDFIPEITYLKALNYFTFCEYEEVTRVMTLFDAKYRPMRDELKAFIDKYKSKEGSKLTDQAFDAYFGPSAGQSELPKAFFTKILRNRDLAAFVRHLDMIDDELELIAVQKSAWRDSLGKHLNDVIAQDQQRIKVLAGRKMLQSMLENYRMLDGLINDGDVLRFEVVDAQRADYMFRSSNPDTEAVDKRPIDFATQTDIIYWPFNGEFWIDELGYYRFTEQGSCK